MVNPESKSVRQAPRDGPFPSHLREITATVRIPDDALVFGDLLAKLEGRPTVTLRQDREGVRGALRGSPGWGSFHSHFTLERRRSGEFVLELEITGRRHGRFQKGTPSTVQFLRDIRAALTTETEQYPAIVGVQYNLPMNTWAPTVQLPFVPPAALDHIPGIPQISGLDFSFSDPGAEQPLLRAFVSTYGQPLDEMVVRILMAQRIIFDQDLPINLAKFADIYLPRFAQETTADE